MLEPSSPKVRPTLADGLTAGILGLIREGALAPGDALPGVRQLAAHFQVTPPTIREALRRLEATAAVELRHGRGVYVGCGVDRIVLANPQAAQFLPEGTLGLLAARLVLEPGIAGTAAQVRAPEALEQLEQAAEGNGDHLVDSSIDRDCTFHQALASATGNIIVRQVIDALLTAQDPRYMSVCGVITDRDQVDEQHRSVVDAVRAQDCVAASELMYGHIADIRRVVSG